MPLDNRPTLTHNRSLKCTAGVVLFLIFTRGTQLAHTLHARRTRRMAKEAYGRPLRAVRSCQARLSHDCLVGARDRGRRLLAGALRIAALLRCVCCEPGASQVRAERFVLGERFMLPDPCVRVVRAT